MDEKSKQAEVVTYVVAVSGGVDSVVLLDILAGVVAGRQAERQMLGGELADAPFRLVVAHFDHGIRPDSGEDRRFVQGLAQRYGLPFVYDEGRLGPGASEAAARQARYAFLRRVGQASHARAIVTAHHEDDVLETALINLLRGTGRKGLSSLRSTAGICRPLLEVPKARIKDYARQHGLEWREDSTNADTTYLRNYVRHVLLLRAGPAGRRRLREMVLAAQEQNQVIDRLLAEQLELQSGGSHPGRLERHWFIMLPHAVAREAMAAWLRQSGINGFDRRTLERLVVAGKTLAPGKQADIDGRWVMLAGRRQLVLARR